MSVPAPRAGRRWLVAGAAVLTAVAALVVVSSSRRRAGDDAIEGDVADARLRGAPPPARAHRAELAPPDPGPGATPHGERARGEAPDEAPRPTSPTPAPGPSSAPGPERAPEATPAAPPPVEPAPSAEPGAERARGSLPREAVRDVVRAALPELRFCFEWQLARHPELSGRLTMELTIAEDGAVREAHVAEDLLADETVARCFTHVAGTLRFPPPDPPGEVLVRYPFVLEGAPPPRAPEGI